MHLYGGEQKQLGQASELCGRILPFFSQADHLGNTLSEKGYMEQDASVKRARFITISVEIREQFKFSAPAEIVKGLKV